MSISHRSVVLSFAGVVLLAAGVIVAFLTSVEHTGAAPATIVPSIAVPPSSLPAHLRPMLTPPPLTPPLPPTINPNDGAVGIKPRSSSASPLAPAFSEQDVRNYYSPARLQNGDSPLTIVSISFQSVGQANAAAPVRLNFADDQLVCVVHLSGKISVPGQGGQPATTHSNVYDVYDAHTGNLIAEAVR